MEFQGDRPVYTPGGGRVYTSFSLDKVLGTWPISDEVAIEVADFAGSDCAGAKSFNQLNTTYILCEGNVNCHY